jgi:tetratricopeptide (TPR) repeat protein
MNDHLNNLLHHAWRLRSAGDLAGAARAFEQALRIDPSQSEATHELGIIHAQLGRIEAALDLLRRAIALRPDDSLAHFNHAKTLDQLRRENQALAGYDMALRLRPDFAEAGLNRAQLLRNLNRHEEALTSCERAIALKPALAAAHLTRGNVLRDLARHDEALASCDRSISIRKDYAEAFTYRAITLSLLGRYDEAFTSYRRSIALKPDYAKTYCNMGLLQLLLGNYEEGWGNYEWRWGTGPATGRMKDIAQPLWRGDVSVSDRRLLLRVEQGLGDVVQFVRYLPLVEELGARVILQTPAALMPLLRSLKGRHTLIAKDGDIPDHDLHCPLMSLPLAFRTRLDTIPATIPYLFADPARRRAWQARLGARRRPRIGLAWSGNPANRNDSSRSLPLRMLLPCLSLAFDYHVLQKEIRPDDEAVLRGLPFVHRHEALLHDFAETAALMAEMDLVISVDTSIAHVAGALGRPLWILLPHNPDWRWLTARTDSPWYPTARLFRQRRPGEWEDVIEEVREALARDWAGSSGR